MMKEKILVADDEQEIADLIEVYLENEGFQVRKFYDSKEALACIETEVPDLAVLDIMMPDISGLTLCRKIREKHNYPIIMLTAKNGELDKINGLALGADDYMTKPVDEEEMILRIRALLRRAQIVNERRITIADVCLDYDSLTVSRGDESQTLPRKEFYLLYKLLSYPGKIFTRIQLMDEIWGMESQSDDNTINVHINRLRKRFEDYPEFTIETIRGLGYKAVKHL